MNEFDLLEQKLLKNKKFKNKYLKHDLAYEVSLMLTEARIIRGVTQEKLAKLIHTKQTSIARAESGKSLPSLSFLKKIADAFGTYLICPSFAFMKEKVKVSEKTVANTERTIDKVYDNNFQYISKSVPEYFLTCRTNETYDNLNFLN